ncbi:MAG: TldD/PmbA family protein [Bacteroidota bacterium]
MLTQQESQAIIAKVLKSAKADETEVSISSGTTTHLRFARNTPSTSGRTTDTVVTVQCTLGTRTGSARTNQLDEESLRSMVRTAEELARLAPEDAEFMPALGPQQYPTSNAWVDETAEAGSPFLASGAEECIRSARDRGLVAAGFLRIDAESESLGNSAGLFAYHRSTIASMSETVRTPDGGGSGWVSRAANSVRDIDFKEVASIAVTKALESRNPRKIEPGKYTTILEPSCVADMVRSLLFAMDARNADEGRSYFSRKGGGTKLGEKIFPENISLASDPSDRRVPGSPWGEDGIAQKRVEWIDQGIVKNLRTSRYWAKKQGRAPVAFPPNTLMTGGKGSLQDLIRSTKKGLLVTSFWYIRSVDPQTLMLTGLTRDGVFWIEDGVIAFPVMNFRWNESPAAVLQNVESMSQSQRVPPRESATPTMMIPALKVRDFNFSSLSEAV